MTTFVAFLRGIGPTNPNMRNEKLREAFEQLGYQHVRSVISSGNIIFDAPMASTAKLEETIEQQLQSVLQIPGRTIIRSQAELQALVQRQPFGNQQHSPKQYLTVTFLKDRNADIPLLLPKDNDAKRFGVRGADTRVSAVFCVTDTTANKTPNLMVWLEKQLGKDITTRTWKTIERVVKVMV